MPPTYIVCEICRATAPAGTPGWQDGRRETFEFPGAAPNALSGMSPRVTFCPDHAIRPIETIEQAAGVLKGEYDRTLRASDSTERAE